MGVIGIIFSQSKSAHYTSDQTNSVLRTRTYNININGSTFCNEVKDLIPKLSTYSLHWKLVSSECNPNKNSPYIIRAEVPVFFFTDDLEIRMHPSADSTKLNIDISSKSRIGKNDFGENRRHIVELFDAIESHFNKRT
jgi:hypothetical protein